MTQEDIEKAADEYVNEACRPLWRNGYEQVCKVDFMQGAKWRIDSVWHDADSDQEPEKGKLCILEVEVYDEDGERYIDYVSSQWGRFGWTEDYLEIIQRRSVRYNIIRWAYIYDLAPGKEE